MPNYDYTCPGCGAKVEIYCVIKDRNNQRCPECGALLLKEISVGNVILFEPYWDDCMDTEPVLVESAEQKKQELEKRGLQPRC